MIKVQSKHRASKVNLKYQIFETLCWQSSWNGGGEARKACSFLLWRLFILHICESQCIIFSCQSIQLVVGFICLQTYWLLISGSSSELTPVKIFPVTGNWVSLVFAGLLPNHCRQCHSRGTASPLDVPGKDTGILTNCIWVSLLMVVVVVWKTGVC